MNCDGAIRGYDNGDVRFAFIFAGVVVACMAKCAYHAWSGSGQRFSLNNGLCTWIVVAAEPDFTLLLLSPVAFSVRITSKVVGGISEYNQRAHRVG